MPVKRKAGEHDRIGTPVEKKLEDIIPPFQRFTHNQTTGSILLIFCTFTALLLANSALDSDYESLLLTQAGLVFGDWSLSMSLRHWINEGLMSLFFFVLGTALSDRILSSHEKNASEAPHPVLHRRRYAGLWSTQHCITASTDHTDAM